MMWGSDGVMGDGGDSGEAKMGNNGLGWVGSGNETIFGFWFRIW